MKMKNLFIMVFLSAFAAGICAQDLDTLLNIRNAEKEAPEKAEKQDNSSSNPVIVDNNADEVNVTVGEKEILKVTESGDSTVVTVGEKPVVKVVDQPDSTTIRLGDKEISIVEKDGNTDVHIGHADHGKLFCSSRFRGHWAGFEWGINNFLDAENTLSREGEASFMDLNTGRSWAINLDFAQYSLGFGTNHFGSVIGLGLGFNNYFFDGDNTMAEVNDYVVGVDTTGISKSKLTTTFLRLPLFLEVQFPNTIRATRMFISAGVIGGLKLGSHTKVVYENEYGHSKVKNKDDFNINPFRFGVIARIGFGCISVFGEYYFTPMYVEGKGPDLYPFSAGLALVF
jgi:Outer membrane protein beta-barrel domain